VTTAPRPERTGKGPGMDVHFYSEGTLIAGTLAEVPRPVAAALLITGSGRLNRDSDARLGRRGPVVLRTGVTRQVAEALGAADGRHCATTSGGSARAAATTCGPD
jgi:hypothetical protein